MMREQSNELANQDWERTDHDWSQKLAKLAKEKFGIQKFRPYQLATMNATMSGQDCILLMPTGGGKSLCFQLPALLSSVHVVQAMIIMDQVLSLKERSVPAEMLSASTPEDKAKKIQADMLDPDSSLRILYLTPEKLAKSKRFMAKVWLTPQGLGDLAEPGCPDYKFLGVMKRQFPEVPILGLTATATSDVIEDVQELLHLEGCLVLRASFNRPNLFYKVPNLLYHNKTSAQLHLLFKINLCLMCGAGIIYCFSIKDTEEVSSDLRKRGISARAYHAQTDAETRQQVHLEWREGKIKVVVATVAFGMGIDKPDVRFVIHHSLSKAMETYYQESGRAGWSLCPLLFYPLLSQDFIFNYSLSSDTCVEENKPLEYLNPLHLD
ncbi:RECQL [Cordylochernes scorpioides]|uniref:DNA 3'-5' helicase n=1 Tax=Cordylochernes scorpioides TaxID=51811 RepID=A0ABY6LGX2_9ARAC|nr:RECQL [Cordylochernes scorpioides]